jgi:hypothetical protein
MWYLERNFILWLHLAVMKNARNYFPFKVYYGSFSHKELFLTSNNSSQQDSTALKLHLFILEFDLHRSIQRQYLTSGFQRPLFDPCILRDYYASTITMNRM